MGLVELAVDTSDAELRHPLDAREAGGQGPLLEAGHVRHPERLAVDVPDEAGAHGAAVESTVCRSRSR